MFAFASASCLLKAQNVVVVVSIFVFQGGCFCSVAAACWFICSHNFGESFNVLLIFCQLIFPLMWLCLQIDVNAACQVFLSNLHRESISQTLRLTPYIAATACVPHILSDTGLGELGVLEIMCICVMDFCFFFKFFKRGKKKWLYTITCAPIFN
jgi:hypothetical protein